MKICAELSEYNLRILISFTLQYVYVKRLINARLRVIRDRNKLTTIANSLENQQPYFNISLIYQLQFLLIY